MHVELAPSGCSSHGPTPLRSLLGAQHRRSSPAVQDQPPCSDHSHLAGAVSVQLLRSCCQLLLEFRHGQQALGRQGGRGGVCVWGGGGGQRIGAACGPAWACKDRDRQQQASHQRCCAGAHRSGGCCHGLVPSCCCRLPGWGSCCPAARAPWATAPCRWMTGVQRRWSPHPCGAARTRCASARALRGISEHRSWGGRLRWAGVGRVSGQGGGGASRGAARQLTTGADKKRLSQAQALHTPAAANKWVTCAGSGHVCATPAVLRAGHSARLLTCQRGFGRLRALLGPARRRVLVEVSELALQPAGRQAAAARR